MAANNEKNINKNLEKREQKAFEKHAELMEKAEKLKIDAESLDKEMNSYGEKRNSILESNQDVEKQQKETEEALQKIERLLSQFEKRLFADNLSNDGLQFERSQVKTISLSGKDRERARETNKDFTLILPEGYSVQSVDGKKPESSWCRKVEKNAQELRIGYLTMKKLDGKQLVLTGPEGEIKCAIEVTKGTNANGEIEASIKSLEAPMPAVTPVVEPVPAPAPASPSAPAPIPPVAPVEAVPPTATPPNAPAASAPVQTESPEEKVVREILECVGKNIDIYFNPQSTPEQKREALQSITCVIENIKSGKETKLTLSDINKFLLKKGNMEISFLEKQPLLIADQGGFEALTLIRLEELSKSTDKKEVAGKLLTLFEYEPGKVRNAIMGLGTLVAPRNGNDYVIDTAAYKLSVSANDPLKDGDLKIFLKTPTPPAQKPEVPAIVPAANTDQTVKPNGAPESPTEAATNKVEDTLKTLKTKIDTSKGLDETKSALEDAARALSSMTETLDKNQIKNIENKGFSFGNKIYSLKLEGLVFVVKNRIKPKEKAPTQIVKEEMQKVIREFQALQNTRNKKAKKPDIEQFTKLAGTLSAGIQKIQSIEGFPPYVLSPNADALVNDTEKKLENVKIGSDTYKLVYDHASFEFRVIQIENTPAPEAQPTTPLKVPKHSAKKNPATAPEINSAMEEINQTLATKEPNIPVLKSIFEGMDHVMQEKVAQETGLKDGKKCSNMKIRWTPEKGIEWNFDFDEALDKIRADWQTRNGAEEPTPESIEQVVSELNVMNRKMLTANQDIKNQDLTTTTKYQTLSMKIAAFQELINKDIHTGIIRCSSKAGVGYEFYKNKAEHAAPTLPPVPAPEAPKPAVPPPTPTPDATPPTLPTLTPPLPPAPKAPRQEAPPAAPAPAETDGMTVEQKNEIQNAANTFITETQKVINRNPGKAQIIMQTAIDSLRDQRVILPILFIDKVLAARIMDGKDIYKFTHDGSKFGIEKLVLPKITPPAPEPKAAKQAPSVNPKQIAAEEAARREAEAARKAAKEKPSEAPATFTIDSALPEDIQKQIRTEKVLENLKKSPTFKAESGRLYRMVEGKIYYNSKPNEKKTWGELSNEKPTFVEINGKFTEIKLLGPQNSLPHVFETVDGNFILDEKGTLAAPNQNGVFKFPGKDLLFYKRVAGKLENCDATGTLRAEYIENMLKRLSDAGFQAKYEGSGFFTTREVSMKFDENLSIRLFQLLVNTGKDGKFCIQCEAENETSYSSVDEVIKAAKQRKEKIDTLTKDIDLAEKITTNPEKHRMYGKLFEQLNEVRDSFSSGSTDKMLFAQFANQAAWAVVENHMKGNPQGLKLEDAAKYIQHLYDSLSNSRNPAPNQVDTVAQYYKLQFENNGETKAKALAIDLLQKTIGKSREVGNWNQLEPDDRKQVEENEKLLKKLKE